MTGNAWTNNWLSGLGDADPVDPATLKFPDLGASTKVGSGTIHSFGTTGLRTPVVHNWYDSFEHPIEEVGGWGVNAYGSFTGSIVDGGGLPIQAYAAASWSIRRPAMFDPVVARQELPGTILHHKDAPEIRDQASVTDTTAVTFGATPGTKEWGLVCWTDETETATEIIQVDLIANLSLNWYMPYYFYSARQALFNTTGVIVPSETYPAYQSYVAGTLIPPLAANAYPRYFAWFAASLSVASFDWYPHYDRELGLGIDQDTYDYQFAPARTYNSQWEPSALSDHDIQPICYSGITSDYRLDPFYSTCAMAPLALPYDADTGGGPPIMRRLTVGSENESLIILDNATFGNAYFLKLRSRLNDTTNRLYPPPHVVT